MNKNNKNFKIIVEDSEGRENVLLKSGKEDFELVSKEKLGDDEEFIFDTKQKAVGFVKGVIEPNFDNLDIDVKEV